MLQRLVLAVTLAALLSSCSHSLPLTLDPNVPVKVLVRDGPRYTLEPTSPDYQKLALWVTRNRSGWALYVVTAPPIGVAVNCGSWSLNFLQSSVLVTTPEGVFHKATRPDEYEFLRTHAPGT